MSHNSAPTLTTTSTSGAAIYWSMQPSVHFLELAKDRLTVKYTGKANHSHDVGAIRSDRPLPTNTGMGYYEVTIIDAGSKACISVGLANHEIQLNRMPGMDVHSVGYFGEEGRKCQDGRKGEIYGPAFSSGDIVGCGLDYRKQEVFFTFNGRYLGVAFSSITGILYPVVGLHHPGQIVTANFGHHAFKFDIQGHMEDEHDQMMRKISDIPLEPNLVNTMIEGYLLHYAFEETAVELSRHMKDRDYSSHPLWKTLDSRAKVRRLVLDGRIEEALSLAFDSFPQALKPGSDEGQRVLFLCRCQQFIEMIRNGDLSQCLKFMTHDLGNFCRQDAVGVDHGLLKEVVALLAYENPFNSPLEYLLRMESRENTSDALNHAILKSVGIENPMPGVEVFLKQLSACERQVQEENDNQGSEFGIEKVFHD